MVRQDSWTAPKTSLSHHIIYTSHTRVFQSINTCWSSPRSCRWLPHVWLKRGVQHGFCSRLNNDKSWNYPCNILVNRHNACWLTPACLLINPLFWVGCSNPCSCFLLIDPFKMEQGRSTWPNFTVISTYIILYPSKQWLIPIQTVIICFLEIWVPNKNET